MMPPPGPSKVALVSSGYGRGASVLLQDLRGEDGSPAFELFVTTSDDSDAARTAAQLGVDARVIPYDRDARAAWERTVANELLDRGVAGVVLSGFRYILRDAVLDAFEGAMLNIHPSLLPSFPGLNAIQQALAYGVKVTGSTVHYVDRGLDTGRVVDQVPVRVQADDDAQALGERVFEAGIEMYKRCIRSELLR